MTCENPASFHKLIIGDALEVMKTIDSNSIDMCMTSPPYWGLRDYGVKGQLGLEPTSEDYIQRLREYFRELQRILKPTGSFYLNIGDTYMKKNLQMIPTRTALALRDDGWIIRNDIIWHKPNHMPASVKDRLTNTYEHLFHFVKSKRYYYDLDSIRIPHKTGPSSFNYRVREAKRGHLGIVGVKSNSQEMAGYDNKGQKVRGLKTKGKAQVGKEQHHGQDIGYHPNGKNPGDVVAYNTKFSKQCQASNLLARTAYARKVLGGDHETALNHPLGKNPGDVIQANTGFNNKQPYRSNNPHRMRLEGNMLCSNPLGKNPGDVISQQLDWAASRKDIGMPAFPPQHKDKITSGYRNGTGLAGINPHVQNHPLGKNPGNVFALDHAKMRGQSGEARTNLYRPDRTKYHELGKNPGDVMVLSNWTKSHQLFLDTKGKIGHGHYGGGVFRGVHNHPLGKNPGDVIDAVAETRSKDKLLSQRRRDLTDMRRDGKIHWETHPSKDPRWFNDKGKNPGDIVRANPVRQKSWMSTPGHPFTHSYTGKPRDPSDFWEIRPKPFPGAHFAVYPETLCIMPIKSGCPLGGVVLDPFAGSGTTMKVAVELGRSAIGIELNPAYAEIIENRVRKVAVVRCL